MTIYQTIISTREKMRKPIMNEMPNCFCWDPKPDVKDGVKNYVFYGIDRDPAHLHVSLFSVEDVGNWDYFLARELRRLGCRVCGIRQRDNDHRYPVEFQIADAGMTKAEFDQRMEGAQMFMNMSDVVQIETTWGPIPNSETSLNITADEVLEKFPRDKLIILAHKGTTYRTRTAELEEYYHALPCRKLKIVSTPDLIQLDPENNHWVPNIVGVDFIRRYVKKKERHNDVVVISHSTTHSKNFGTANVVRAVEALERKGYPVYLDITKGRPWRESLESIAASDIHVGKIIHGLPNSLGGDARFIMIGTGTLEAGVFGIPSVSSHDQIGMPGVPDCPAVASTPESLEDDLERLVRSAQYRRMKGNELRRYVEKVHDAPRVAKRWLELVNRAWEGD